MICFFYRTMSDFSYLSAPRTTPYNYRTVVDVFNETSTSYPEKEILIYRGIDGTRNALTYHQLQNEATKLARYLVSKGIKKGDKIALFGPNTLEWVIAELAIIMAGGVVVHVTLSITDVKDLWEIFSSADCKAFLIDPGKGEKYLDMIFQLIALFRRRRPSRDYKDINSNDPTLVFLRKSEHLTSYEDLPGVLQMKEMEVEFPTLYPEDEIMIFTTSGSTGKPKMVSHTHFDVNNVELGPERPKALTLAGKMYNDRPFAWGAGSPILAVCRGETRVFCDSSIVTEKSSTMKIWEVIREEKCTTALLMPSFLADLISQKENYKESFKLQAIITTGQPIENYHTQVIDTYARFLIFGYGSTESSMISMLPPITSAGTIKAGDVGTPIPGTEVKVIGENLNVLKKGETGEICIRSRYLFNGYYQNEDLNKEAFLPGKWFRSGDVGHITKDGHIIIEGRTKDVISRGTQRIMPCTIEDVILQMNGIKFAIVVGVPDKRLYEEVCVCYVTEPGFDLSPSDLKQFCKDNFVMYDSTGGLAEAPTYFLRFCKIPLLDVGKINKRKVKADAIQRLRTQGLI